MEHTHVWIRLKENTYVWIKLKESNFPHSNYIINLQVSSIQDIYNIIYLIILFFIWTT